VRYILVPLRALDKLPGLFLYVLFYELCLCSVVRGTRGPARRRPPRENCYLDAAARALTSPEPKKLLLPAPPEQT
jgi:hypothetical protein